MFQYVLTVPVGKRLIGMAVADMLSKTSAFKGGTIVIVAGSTNGYVVEELFKIIGEKREFNRKRFFRGITTPPKVKTTETGRLPDESLFPGDVVLKNGEWLKGKTIYDVVDSLKKGDIIVKGANCLDVLKRKAGLLIGHPEGGTIILALKAVIGKRVRFIIPVGLEKRVYDDIDEIAVKLNSPVAEGYRLLPITGEIFSEIEAISYLSGAKAQLIAA
ncbi:MAG: hypothetical protein N2053_02820, partial [Chitinispirillaceae bacterium]|nr:hypothetical protein [Chitinispirillaceae bacterium]